MTNWVEDVSKYLRKLKSYNNRGSVDIGYLPAIVQRKYAGRILQDDVHYDSDVVIFSYPVELCRKWHAKFLREEDLFCDGK